MLQRPHISSGIYLISSKVIIRINLIQFVLITISFEYCLGHWPKPTQHSGTIQSASRTSQPSMSAIVNPALDDVTILQHVKEVKQKQRTLVITCPCGKGKFDFQTEYETFLRHSRDCDKSRQQKKMENRKKNAGRSKSHKKIGARKGN